MRHIKGNSTYRPYHEVRERVIEKRLKKDIQVNENQFVFI